MAAVASAKTVRYLMPNIGGMSVLKRQLQISVVVNKLLYMALVWSQREFSYRVNREVITRTQNLATLKISRGYRMVSSMVYLLLAELPPGDLLS